MLIHPMPDPVALKLGPLSVHWYGLMYVLAFTQVIILGRVRLKQPHIIAQGWTREDLDNLLFYGVFGTILGGRLGEVLLYHPHYYFSNPLEILAIWHGGQSYHGGAAGVLFAFFIWSRRNGRSLIDTMDCISPLVPLGYAFGRIGNFINAELPGRIADASLPWAMIWPNIDHLPRHPSPLYQALVNGLLMFILLWLYARKERPKGAVVSMYFLLYGAFRFFTEFFRMPDFESSFAGITLSAGQLYSAPMIAVGLAGFFTIYFIQKRKGN